jgi:hypothetical protein
MELRPSHRSYLLAALRTGLYVAGIASVSFAINVGVGVLRGRPGSHPLDSAITMMILGVGAFVVSLVGNLGRAPTRIGVDSDAIRLTLDGTEWRIAWSEIRSVEFPRRGEWLIYTMTGKRFELWPYAFTSQDRQMLRQMLASQSRGVPGVSV